mgnify:CR=1 FL=1
MKNVVVASLNPVKLEAARLSFSQAFPNEEFTFVGVAALSGVPDQPLSKVETLQGAQNRLVSAQALHPGADFYIAFEAGIEDNEGVMEEFAWVVTTDGHKSGKACSALFLAPPRLRALVIEQGLEVGDATDILFNEENSKQKIGAVGQLTKGAVTRTTLYVQPGILALLPFIHPELY